MPRTESIPEENMPAASPARNQVANDGDIPEENMPAADYKPSEEEANREATAPQQQ